MGALIAAHRVKLITSFIYRDEETLAAAVNRLVRKYGPVEDLKLDLPFDYTDYYQREFGDNLKRKIISFKQLVHPENISRVKLFSNKVEERFLKDKNRTINIDPGYITEAKLILLTTKDYSHRIYLGKNIYAEVTLQYQKESFRSGPWTYPDYASKEFIDYFNEVRKLYMNDKNRLTV